MAIQNKGGVLPNYAVPHDQVLEQLLLKIEKLDFKKIAKSATPQNSELRIIVIDYLLKLFNSNNQGLGFKHGKVFLYNGAYWKAVDPDTVKDFLGKAAGKTGTDWKKHKDYIFKDNLYRQFLSAGNLSSLTSDKNSSVKINLLNGTYHVTAAHNHLQPFDKLDLLTYQLPFEYNLKATCPMFEKFLNTVLPDKQSQMVLAEFIAGAFLSSKTLKLEKALILQGAGANGKSVFFEIVHSLLGRENVSCFSLGGLTNDNGYSRAELENKLINYASEMHGKMKSDIFKQLVSGEPIEVRSPYGKPYILEDYAKFIFNCNELPVDVEHTDAFFRRFLIIPFDQTIPEHKQDKELARKIVQADLPGVFNWVLKGLERLLVNRNFTPCKVSIDKLGEYKKSSNSVLLFLEEEQYIKSVTEQMKLSHIYAEYLSFCRDNSHRPVPNNIFSERLKKEGFDTKRIAAGTIVFAKKKGSNLIAQLT
ncbi:MAG: DNA primase [Sphingobacteriaceae bacterium]|nr:DNA primase [Sphingobacteriaceae bacterium]